MLYEVITLGQFRLQIICPGGNGWRFLRLVVQQPVKHTRPFRRLRRQLQCTPVIVKCFPVVPQTVVQNAAIGVIISQAARNNFV